MSGGNERVSAALSGGGGDHTCSRSREREVDGQVREQFRDGDPDAVRIVYRAYGSLVYAVAWRVLRDRGLCEEATQQAFLRAWRAAASFDASRELGPWLATIARRIAIDLYRREATRTAGSLDLAAPDDPALVTEPETDALLEMWEVRRAVSELPAEQREVVRLQHFQGLAHEDIAVRLGVPLGTVKSRSHRAHRRLMLELEHLRPWNRAEVGPRSLVATAARAAGTPPRPAPSSR